MDRVRISLVELALLAAAAAFVLVLLLQARRPHAPGRRPGELGPHPGVPNPDVTQATIRSTIASAGWTRTVRPPVSYTNHLKGVQLAQYGLRGARSGFQEDHLISLELGGSPTDPRNLWPEPYPRAAEVDRIENRLNHDVCTGALTLAQAQRKESAMKHRDG